MIAAKKVYYNNDLFNLILSFNTCIRCKSAYSKENNAVNIRFYNAYSFILFKWYKRICYDCLKLQINRKI